MELLSIHSFLREHVFYYVNIENDRPTDKIHFKILIFNLHINLNWMLIIFFC